MTTYAILVGDVAEWLARDDLAARIPTFIRLTEAELNRQLRLRALEQSVDLAIDAQGEAVLPADFQKVITATAGECPLDYVSRFTKSNSLSETQYSTLNFTFLAPPNTDEVTLWYYSKLPALTAVAPNDTNWLLQNAYDIYLNGCLMQAQPYLMEDARTQLFATLFQDGIKSLMKSDKKDKLGEAALTPKPSSRWTP